MKLTKTTLLGAVGALSIMATAATSFAVEPVKIRWASDHSGPPHPPTAPNFFSIPSIF